MRFVSEILYACNAVGGGADFASDCAREITPCHLFKKFSTRAGQLHTWLYTSLLADVSTGQQKQICRGPICSRHHMHVRDQIYRRDALT